MQRDSWDNYFLSLLPSIGSRATCNRGKSGAIIVKNNRIICTGYVGSPPKMPHCDEVGHHIIEVIDEGKKTNHCIRTMHAESNAICQAAKFGLSIEGSTIYCTMTPCYNCAMLIASVGIRKVISQHEYQKSKNSKEVFKVCGIEFKCINNTLIDYNIEKEN